jgi:hypothetical protein
MHISCGHGAYQSALVPFAEREGDKDRPPCARSADRNEALFVDRMRNVRRDTSAYSEHGLNFSNRNTVALALRRISLIPIEAVEDEIHR